MIKKNIVFFLVPIISVLMILILMLSFGIIRPAGKTDKPKIIVILKTTERAMDFWMVLEHGVLQASEDFEVDVEITGPLKEGKIDEQISIFNQSIESRPDVIILAAADFYKLAEPVERAVASGIPVLTVDSFVDSDAPSSQIGTANYEAGGKLAEYLKKNLPEGSSIGILSYVRESSTAIEREVGLREGIDGYFDILPTRYNNDNIETAAEDLMFLLEQDTSPVAIVALNETSARGMLMGLSKTSGTQPEILLTFDSNLNIIEAIESGRISGTVVQKPYNMGYQAVKTAVNMLNGQTPPKKIDTGSELVTSENLFSPIIQKLIFPTGSTE